MVRHLRGALNEIETMKAVVCYPMYNVEFFLSEEYNGEGAGIVETKSTISSRTWF